MNFTEILLLMALHIACKHILMTYIHGFLVIAEMKGAVSDPLIFFRITFSRMFVKLCKQNITFYKFYNKQQKHTSCAIEKKVGT